MFTSIGPISLHLFAHHIAWAVLFSAGIAYYQLRDAFPTRALADALVAAVVLGVIGARVEYALLNPDVFTGNVRGLFTLTPGGLDWHGALIGAVAGLGLAARLHQMPLAALLEALTPALPLIAFAGWTACRAIGCVYGTEVETLAFYPAWQVTEGRDIFGLMAPRYDTHTFGQALALALVLLTAALWMVGAFAARPGVRFWLVMLLFSGGMAAIGTVRGDYTPTLAGVRADQGLDAVLVVFALVMLLRAARHTPP